MKTPLKVVFWALTITIRVSVPMFAEDLSSYRQDRILIKPLVRSNSMTNLHAQLGTRTIKSFPLIGNIHVVRVPVGLRVEGAIAEFKRSGLVDFAEPDYLVFPATHNNPNDPAFLDGLLWGLDNDGQDGKLFDADINAPEAWHIQPDAANVIVAVIDSGIRYTHEDLRDNLWQNPREVGGITGVDDDDNGYVDDIYGINVLNGSGNPNDTYGHGTMTSGVIGATGNNGIGVTGVAKRVKLMAVKAWGTEGGSISDFAEGIHYALTHGAQVINYSFVQGISETVREAVLIARNRGVIIAAADGNNSWNTDIPSWAFYPAAYEFDNVVSVIATTRTDTLADFSNYGLVTADLGAPGGEHKVNPGPEDIRTTAFGSDTAYAWAAGTSLSAPMVAGTVALLRARYPNEHYVQLVNRLLSSGDSLFALAGKCQTGRRLDAAAALNVVTPRPPNDSFSEAFGIAFPGAWPSIAAVGNNVDATKESGEPLHGGNAGGQSVWWKFAPTSSATVYLRTEGSSFRTVLAVYTGNSVNSLTAVPANSEACQCETSKLSFAALAGNTYWIAVDGVNDGAGIVDSGVVKLTLDKTTPPANPDLKFDRPSIARSANQFSARITGRPSATIRIEKSASLDPTFDRPNNEWTTWELHQTTVLSSTGTYDFVDANAALGTRFYRAKITDSPTQVSCNVVGYVDMTLPTGDSLIANQFLASDNRVVTLFPQLTGGVVVYKWNDAAQSWLINQLDFEFGWDDPEMTVLPSEGIVFRNGTGAPVASCFKGEVVQGYGISQLPAAFSIRSSRIPQQGKVAAALHLPASEGDEVYKMVNGSYETYTFTNGSWSPSEPAMAVGEAFWNNKTAAANWQRTYLFSQ